MADMKRPANMSRIRSFFERWERLETQRRELSDDLKELFSEAKGEGFNSKALRAAFAEKFRAENEPSTKAEKRQMDEADADLYLAALASPSHACEASQSYAEQKGRGFVAGLTAEQKAAALAYDGDDTHGEITEHEQPETAQELPATSGTDRRLSVAGPKDAVGRQSADTLRAERERPSEGVTAGETALHSNPPAQPSQALADKTGEAVPPPSVSPVALSDDDVPTFLKKDKPRKTAADYRPHCQHPEACGSSGLHHCYQCQKAIASEAVPA